MGLHLISIHHAEHGLAAVERISPAVPGLARRVVERSLPASGAVVLATCNRVEVYVDADESVVEVAAAVREAIVEELESPHLVVPFRALTAGDALRHLFQVGAGLDSMVVGEREIAGQLRRALKSAQVDGTATRLLTEVIEQALRTARKVSHLTQLAANGRSVVAVGLDMLRLPWESTHVLLLGTGAYAGAVVADLTARGCTHIAVHSASGRAEGFAETHPGVRQASSLDEALGDCDLVVTCRGLGTPSLRADDVAHALRSRGGRELIIIDLAIARDVEPAVGDLDGVVLVDLPTIQRHVPDASRGEVGRARELVEDGLHDLVVRLKGREMDPVVVALRDTVSSMVEDEVQRLPQGRPITREEAAHALRRLAARLVHVPSVRARKAAEEGRTDQYLTALSELWGIQPQVNPVLRNLEIDPRQVGGTELWPSAAVVPPDTLDDDVCPVTGFGLTDLGEPRRLEAM